MAIDDLIGMKLNVPPDAIDDLARVPAPPQRLAILGKTKSLSRLGAWPKVEALWIGDANESQFREILPLIDPLYLNFNGLRVADLSPLGGLRRLQALEITWNTKVSDISFLAGLTSLRLLALSHCPKVHDLRPVANLENLEILDLSGGMWSTFKPDTLAPLRSLRKLRGLSLKAIRVGDRSLAPLAGLKRLETLELSNQFPTEEYARLSVALPHVDCDYFRPYVDFPFGGETGRVMVTGKGKPVLSLSKDAQRLDRFVARFHAMQAKFRNETGQD